jgi:dihydrodipicolinate reductase
MTRVAVHGAAGRMGRNILKVLIADKGATLVSAIDR